MRKGIIFVLIATLLLLSAGCTTPSQPSRPSSKMEPVANQVSTIRLLEWGYDPILDSIISAYMDKYPGDRVVKVPSTDEDDLETVKLRIENHEVDVVPIVFANPMVEEKLLLPLDPYIKASKFDLGPYGPGLDQYRYNGELFDLPFKVFPLMLVYNADMFKAEGIPAPRPDWTWDQFRSAANQLTKSQGDQRIWGFAAPLMFQVVAARVDQSARGMRLPEPGQVKETLEFFSTMIFTDHAIPLMSTATPSSDSTPNPFVTGNAAMTMESLSYLRFMGATLPFQWDVAPLPTMPGLKSRNEVTDNSYGIAATTSNPEAAWRFLSFMTGPEGAAISATVGNLPGYINDDVKRAWFDRNPPPPPGTEALVSIPWSVRPRWGDAVESKKYQLLRPAVTQTLSGQKPLDQAAAEYAEQYGKLMAGGSN